MTITIERIEAVAPDQASLNAANKLLKRTKWPMLEQNAAGTVLWGQCQGSGSTPYSMAVDVKDLGAKCSCPSRKFPCKHSIALMWWFADNAQEFTTGDTPEWVSQWLSRRRGSSATTDDKSEADKPKLSASNAKNQALEKKLSPEELKKKEERAARQKRRNRDAREAAIAQGLDELDLWISDQLKAGFADFENRAQVQGAILVKRLVDAKAPGLAGRVENMVADYYGTEYQERGPFLTEALGMLHLLANAYRQQNDLPAGLQADVRTAIGWTAERENILSDKTLKRVTGEWLVMGLNEEAQTDRMLRVETWLVRTDSEQSESAVLMDFVPLSSGAGRSSIYNPGQTLKATVIYYPSSTMMRALLVDSEPVDNERTAVLPTSGMTTDDVIKMFLEKRVINPWLEHWPVLVEKVCIKRTADERLWAVGGNGEQHVLPVASSAQSSASVLLGLQDISLYGLFDGKQLQPMAASTPIGTWWGTSV